MAHILTQSVSRWIDFAVKTFIVVFTIYLGIAALLIPVYSTLNSVKQVMDTATKEITRLELSSDDLSAETRKALEAISLAMGLAKPDVQKYQKIHQELHNESPNR